MNYFKKGLQLVLIVAAAWFMIQNWDVKVAKISLFNKEIPNASVVFVIFASMIIGALISAFFSALKEWKTVREHRKTVKEMKNTIKDLELRSKDLTIAENDLEKLKTENDSLNKEIKTLKEVMKYPNKAIEKNDSDKLIDY